MRIKLAILETDNSYLNRLVSIFNTKYSDKLEVYSFTDAGIALDAVVNQKLDVLIVGNQVDFHPADLPARCGFGYLVDMPGVEEYNNQKTIFKFQKADFIYRQILSIYAENVGNLSGVKITDYSTKNILFTSPAGGVGTSTVAAACALHQAKQGKKVLFLNLEKYSGTTAFFRADGNFSMSDVIFALKSRKSNLAFKLESCVQQEEDGVFFYSEPKHALDMMELKSEDINRMIMELNLTGEYDYIILTRDFGLSEEDRELWRKMHQVIWVSDGSMSGNQKCNRAYEALKLLETDEDVPLTQRMGIIYNRYSGKTGKTEVSRELKMLGGTNIYQGAETREIVKRLSEISLFGEIG